MISSSEVSVRLQTRDVVTGLRGRLSAQARFSLDPDEALQVGLEPFGIRGLYSSSGLATSISFRQINQQVSAYRRKRRSGLVLIMVWTSSAGMPRSSMQAMNWRRPSTGVDSA